MANADNTIEKICNSYFKSRNYKQNPQIRQLNAILVKDDEKLIKLIGLNLFKEIAISLFQRENTCEKTAFILGFKYAIQWLTENGKIPINYESEVNGQ